MNAAEYFYLEHDTIHKYKWPSSSDSEEELCAIQPTGALTFEKVVILATGQHILTHEINIAVNYIFDISFTSLTLLPVPTSSRLVITCSNSESEDFLLLNFSLSLLKPSQKQIIRLSVSSLEGHSYKFKIAIESPDNEFASIGISRLGICSEDAFPRLKALANYDWRLKNEIGHFSGQAYTHSMYGDQIAGKGIVEFSENIPIDIQSSFLISQEAKLRSKLKEISPHVGEPVFGYAQRCLGEIIPLTPPNFFARASSFSKEGQTLRILSICSGAARIEEEIIKHCKGSIHLTLLDASEELLQRAASRFSEVGHTVRCLVSDINNGLPGDELFDVIICVSALHHVVNLERVLTQINERLSATGEFWSIGEQVGQNGNRLWPKAFAAANNAFRRLPETYRKNKYTGLVDETIHDDDFSTSCFEGVRSEELGAMLENYLVPVDVYKRNCFLWRLTDATYCDNYNLSSATDLDFLRELVAAEAMHWVAGGISTELHGVYCRKQF